MNTKRMSTTRRSPRASGCLVILNDRGLHTRPSTELVKCASSFRSTIKLAIDGMEVNAKSLLGVMTLAAEKGSRICIEAEGPDAAEAVDAVEELGRHQFHIQY